MRLIKAAVEGLNRRFEPTGFSSLRFEGDAVSLQRTASRCRRLSIDGQAKAFAGRKRAPRIRCSYRKIRRSGERIRCTDSLRVFARSPDFARVSVGKKGSERPRRQKSLFIRCSQRIQPSATTAVRQELR